MKNYFFFIGALLLCTGAAVAQSWNQVGTDIDGLQEGDAFGWSMDITTDGTRLVVGAPKHGFTTDFAGQVTIYDLLDDQWIPVGNSIDGTQALIDFGYAVAISDDGNRIAVGAPKADPFGIDKGSVRIFELIDSNWLQLGNQIDGSFVFDQAGQSVALSADGNRIAVGAHLNDGSGPNRGHVRVFDLINGNWEQVGANVNGENTSAQSGWSVSLSADGNKMAVGAVSNNENGLLSGQVRTYQFNGIGWEQIGSDLNGMEAGDRLGWSLDLSNDGLRLAIGAPQNIASSDASGYVNVYELVGGSWTLMGSPIVGITPNEEFGSAVRINAAGTKVAIGAPGFAFTGDQQGVVRVFQYIANSWILIAAPIIGEGAGDLSGAALAFTSEGNRVAIGAIGNSGETDDAGHVRVYEEGKLGTDGTNSEESILLYPNPAATYFSITGLQETAVYTINDLSGRRIQKGNLQNKEAIATENIASGAYIVQLWNEVDGTFLASEKIIIR